MAQLPGATPPPSTGMAHFGFGEHVRDGGSDFGVPSPCIAQSRGIPSASELQQAAALAPGLRVCTHAVLELSPGSRSSRSLGWHEPLLDNITMLDDGDIQYWRHYVMGGSTTVVAVALSIGARWAEKLSVGPAYRIGKSIANAHDWRQVEVRPGRDCAVASSASWHCSVLHLSVDPQNVAELAQEADAARARLSSGGTCSVPGRRWSGLVGTSDVSSWAPKGSAIRAAGLLLRSVPSRLASLSIVCDHMEKGWWTTSVCPGDKITQFHKQDEPADAGDDDVEVDVPRTSLGEFVIGSDRLIIPGQRGEAGGETTSPRLSAAGPYLSQQFVNGTSCSDDEPSLRRTTELRVQCLPGATRKMLAVTEPRTCHYEVTVGSAAACGHPLLQVESLVRPPLEQVDAVGPTVAVQCAPMREPGARREE